MATPEHGSGFPTMVLGGVGRGFTVTGNVPGMLAPQAFMARRVILPEAEPTVTLMELVVEVPVQPAGNDQL